MVSLTVPSHAYIPDLFVGADDDLNEKSQQSLGAPLPIHLLPSGRFAAQRTITNLRFMGNYGTYKPDLTLPFQLQDMGENENGNFPQDPHASLLQCLFPSPDGVVLLANQALSDSISKIDSAMMGSILRQVYDFRQGTLEEERLYKNVVSTILSQTEFKKLATKPGLIERFREDYEEFIAHDFYMNIARTFTEGVSNMSENEQQTLFGRILKGTQGEGELFSFTETDIFKQRLSDYSFAKKDVDNVEEFYSHWTERRLQKIKRDLAHKNLTGPSDPKDAKLLSDFEKQIYFEEHRDIFRAISFANVLLCALKEESRWKEGYQQSFPYPSSTLDQALTSYAWLKATTLDDVVGMYNNFLQPSLPLKPEIFGRVLDNASYENLKQMFISGKVKPTQENLANLSRGFEIYESPLPPLVQYKSAAFLPKVKSRLKGTHFPDCVESSIRNVLNILSRTESASGWTCDVNALPLTPQAREVYETDPIRMFSQETHSKWGSFLTQLPDVIYCKPTTAKKNQRKFEIHTGILNVLNTICHIFETPRVSELKKSIEGVSKSNFLERIETIEESLGKLFSSHSTNVTCSITDEDDEDDPATWKDKFEDFFGQITFSINDARTFYWVQDEDHAYVKYCELAIPDWRKEMSLDISSEHPNMNFIPFLSSERLYGEYLGPLSAPAVKDHFWATDLDKTTALLHSITLGLIYNNTWGKMLPISLQYVMNFDDEHLTTQLASNIWTQFCLNPDFYRNSLLLALKGYPQLLDTPFPNTSNSASQEIREEQLEDITSGSVFERSIESDPDIVQWGIENLEKVSIDNESSIVHLLPLLPRFSKLEVVSFANDIPPAGILGIIEQLPSTVSCIVLSSHDSRTEINSFLTHYFKLKPNGHMILDHSDQLDFDETQTHLSFLKVSDSVHWVSLNNYRAQCLASCYQAMIQEPK